MQEHKQPETTYIMIKKAQADTLSTSYFSVRTLVFLTHSKMKILTFSIFIFIVIMIFGVCFDFNYTSSGSMEPALIIGDMSVGNKLAYIFTDPQRGDIISFYSREKQEVMGKRVIGLEGDQIEFHDGYVYINGTLYDESSYLDEDVETNSLKSFTVPENCVFVLGDNRENSADSRFWNNPYINISDIRDKHLFNITLTQLL